MTRSSSISFFRFVYWFTQMINKDVSDLRLKTALVSYVGFIALCKASKSSIAATIEISIKSKNPHFWLPNIFFEFEFLWMSTISLFILGQLLFRENNYSKWEIFVARDPTGFYLHLTQLHPYNLYHITYMPHIICVMLCI